MLGLLIGLALLELRHRIFPRLLTGCGMLVFFKSSNLMEFEVGYLALFRLFTVIDGFVWFWMGSLHRSIKSVLEFVKAPFLLLYFSYYTLTTFLIILSVILLSIMMILLSNLSVIRPLTCGHNLSCLLNLNLIYETLQTGAGRGLLISMLKKLNLN